MKSYGMIHWLLRYGYHWHSGGVWIWVKRVLFSDKRKQIAWKIDGVWWKVITIVKLGNLNRKIRGIKEHMDITTVETLKSYIQSDCML